MARSLEGPELVAYAPLCPPDRLRRVRVAPVPWLPAGAAGLTLGTLVLVRDDDDRLGTRALLAHELVHVRQFGELGAVRFLVRYLAAYARGLRSQRRHHAAYLAIPLEREARASARRWADQARAAGRTI
jgi:hypothetical protein